MELQFVQRRFVIAKQHNIPMGKKQIARHIPQPSYSSVRTPIRQFGQLPVIMTGPAIFGIVMPPIKNITFGVGVTVPLFIKLKSTKI